MRQSRASLRLERQELERFGHLAPLIVVTIPVPAFEMVELVVSSQDEDAALPRFARAGDVRGLPGW